MADSATGLERSFDSTAYSPVAGGDRPAADRTPRTGIPADQPAPPDLGSLLKLAAKKQEIGADGEAEELFRSALEIADRMLGPDHPELILLITDLTRLQLKKSAFASAEPLLLRLLEIKRAKGEDHPEVATVLASLANVRQALGRHESAEQLWRRVLEIRERTLAPNHFAIATALEHLGAACAARGKIAEALTAFQRALSIRERTLGAQHPSLRTSRERIADLQLQGSDDSLDLGTAPDVSVAPERYRLMAGDSPAPTPPESIALTPPPAPAHRERKPASAPKKASVVIHGRFIDRIAGVADAAPAPAQAANESAALSAAIAPTLESAASQPAPFLEALENLRDELENSADSRTLRERADEIFGPVLTFLGRKEAILGMVAAVIALLIVAVAMDSRAFGGASPTVGVASAEAPDAPRTITPAVPSKLGTTEAAISLPVSNTVSKVTPPSRSHAAEERSIASRRAPEKTNELKPIAMPALSTSVMSKLDSAAARAAGVTARIGDPVVAPVAAPLMTHRATFEDVDQSAGPQRAQLIGDLPTPRVPAQVADVEGEVRVQFSVDAQGHPMMGTVSVVHSPNPLLTTAVRKVIPGMLFEPARTGGPDAKPIVDVVQIGFQFSRRE
jgi:tetratricopeptide (TPR) repeat protein